jgi:hypothetical protein
MLIMTETRLVLSRRHGGPDPPGPFNCVAAQARPSSFPTWHVGPRSIQYPQGWVHFCKRNAISIHANAIELFYAHLRFVSAHAREAFFRAT